MADRHMRSLTPSHQAPTCKHNILTLPPELTERIAELVDPHDLMTLRLTNRETHLRAERAFTKAHFTDRAFLLCDADSLVVLSMISQHPRYARSLKLVSLCADEVPSPIETWPVHIPDFDPDRRSDEEKSAHAVAFDKQRTMQMQDIDVALLTMIFSRFRRLGNNVKVRITDTWYLTYDRPARNDRNLRRRIGNEHLWAPFDDDIKPVHKVLDALALSMLPLTHFTIEYDNWGLPIADLVRSPNAVESMRTAFQTLKPLQLEFTINPEDTLQQFDILRRTIESAQQLARLDLTTYMPRMRGSVATGHEVIALSLLGIRLPKLRKLSVNAFLFDFGSLLDFLPSLSALEAARFSQCRFFNQSLAVDLDHASMADIEGMLRSCNERCTITMSRCLLCKAANRFDLNDDEGADVGDGNDEEEEGEDGDDQQLGIEPNEAS